MNLADLVIAAVKHTTNQEANDLVVQGGGLMNRYLRPVFAMPHDDAKALGAVVVALMQSPNDMMDALYLALETTYRMGAIQVQLQNSLFAERTDDECS